MAIYGSLGDLEVTSTDYPSIQPTLDLNFAKTKALDPRITFYRNSLATYTDDKGIIRTVPENVPRFDHDPATGESLGLLIEESRTNRITNSTTPSSWLKYGCTVTANTSETLAPDGTNTAAKVISNGTTNNFGIYSESTYSANTTYTHSIFLKAGNVSSLSLSTNSGVEYSVNPRVIVDLSAGTIITNVGLSATITPYPNGWYLVTVTGTKNGNTTTESIWSYTSNSANLGVTGNYYYHWGGQVEQGSSATSYIPTSGSTVTRAADNVSIAGTNFSSWYNSIEGTAYIDLITRGKSSGTRQAYFCFNSNTSDRWGIYQANVSSTSIDPYTATTGIQYSINNAGYYNFGSRISIGMYQPNGTNIQSAFNGETIKSVNTSINPTVNNLLLGAQFSFENGLIGTIKRFMYYPRRLTNTQLQNLTA